MEIDSIIESREFPYDTIYETVGVIKEFKYSVTCNDKETDHCF